MSVKFVVFALILKLQQTIEPNPSKEEREEIEGLREELSFLICLDLLDI
jgi:hypothetical protein